MGFGLAPVGAPRDARRASASSLIYEVVTRLGFGAGQCCGVMMRHSWVWGSFEIAVTPHSWAWSPLEAVLTWCSLAWESFLTNVDGDLTCHQSAF